MAPSWQPSDQYAQPAVMHGPHRRNGLEEAAGTWFSGSTLKASLPFVGRRASGEPPAPQGYEGQVRRSVAVPLSGRTCGLPDASHRVSAAISPVLVIEWFISRLLCEWTWEFLETEVAPTSGGLIKHRPKFVVVAPAQGRVSQQDQSDPEALRKESQRDDPEHSTAVVAPVETLLWRVESKLFAFHTSDQPCALRLVVRIDLVVHDPIRCSRWLRRPEGAGTRHTVPVVSE